MDRILAIPLGLGLFTLSEMETNGFFYTKGLTYQSFKRIAVVLLCCVECREDYTALSREGDLSGDS